MTMNERWGSESMMADRGRDYGRMISTDRYDRAASREIEEHQERLKRYGAQHVWRLYPYNNINLVQTNIRFPDGSMGAWMTGVMTPEDVEKEYGKEAQIM